MARRRLGRERLLVVIEAGRAAHRGWDLFSTRRLPPDEQLRDRVRDFE